MKEMTDNLKTTSSFEENVYNLGKEIFKSVKTTKNSFFDRSFWSSKMMELGMKDEKLKIQLFRFVDVLPMIKTDEQLAKHIQEYFGDFKGENSEIIKLLAEVGSSNIITRKAASLAVKTGTNQMARTFIAGENVKEIIKAVSDLRKKNMTVTVDILGEAVLSEKESDYYHGLYMDLISGLSNESKKWETVKQIDVSPHGELPKTNVSVKLSSLYSQSNVLDFKNTVDKLKERFRPILKKAKEENAFVYLDMEDYHFKDIVISVFKEILLEEEFKSWKDAGIVIQAYLKDSEADLIGLIEWTKLRKTPISIRLVKGAYWDYETIISKQKNWHCPVFPDKYETDANYEKLTKILLDAYPNIFPAIASHNIRSLAHAKAYSEKINLPKNAIEFQFLYGMADPIKQAFVDMGERVRVYSPCGELVPGMAYLVRRLLENTANDSFLRQGFADGVDEDRLLKDPSSIIPLPAHALSTSASLGLFSNEPDTDFSIASNREKMKLALDDFRKNLNKKYPLIIDGKKVETVEWADSINPSKSSESIGKFALASFENAEAAVKAALNAFDSWRDESVEKRANILFKAADIMRKKKFELAAVMVLEEGKPWHEADGDVSEAIDFLNYYSIEAKKLFTPKKLISPSGEDNYSFYQARGVSAIISPWNFPLAILTGMASAAIISGNTVILKPAKQASIIAAYLIEILEEAGLPAGVCNYLPGEGRKIGNYLVTHKDISLVAFTGSMEVGLSINKLCADVKLDEGQDFVKKVICEMGGKNAIIVDDDADLDEAVKGVIYSAFGYAGQKCSACSRVIVVKEAYESFLNRLVEAVKSIKQGESEDPGVFLGPVIDKSAFENTLKYIEIGKNEGKLLTGGNGLKDGFFIEPTVFSDVNPSARIAQEEIFAPVLAVIKAENFDDAIKIANGVKFALTGGLFSRSPGNTQKAKEKFRVGNLYINRSSTGAKVGRQPFGGFKMSGIGSKAGGEDYLLQFVEPRVITENTMRRGFAPE